jgi:malonyl-CoA/methylmalonyl-CoA synthetase
MASANLYDLIDAAAVRAGTKTAFRIPGGPSISYAGLRTNVARFANALVSLGVAPGDRVLAQTEKSLESVYLYLATLKAGAVYNPLNTAYTPAELDYFIGDADPKLIVLSAKTAAACNTHDRAFETMEADGSGSLTERAAAAPTLHTTVARAGDDLAALLYTSGTTGRSKGAMITHGNLSSNAKTLLDAWKFQSSDVLLHALPIFHVHGLFVALHTALLNASEMIWLTKFDAREVLRHLPETTVMMGVPTFYTRLLAEPALDRKTCRGMRLFVAGSAPLLAETHDTFRARTGHAILERYGMTETGMITSNPYDGDRRAGTVGYALPGIYVRIANEHGEAMPTGEPGVIEVKGPNVFKGYWRNPEKTAEGFRADGWFITGDVATAAPDGRITIVGRAKDLIISGGYNVYPKEIETELDALPCVDESAVIGVPHPDFGEGVIAILTAKGGTVPSEAEIQGALASKLAKFKQPKRVFVVPELPRNAMGKVQKAALRQTYGDVFKR